MSEELSRTIAILSIVVSVGGLALAVRSCRKPARVRIPMELGMLGISFGVLPLIAAVTGVPTNPALAAAAVALGLGAGAFQGSHLSVRRDGERLFAQRSIPAIGAWGAGILVVQGAGAASRAGVLELGQALSYFGVAMSFGLMVGRQGVLNRVALAGLMVVAAGLGAGLISGPDGERVAAQAPQPTPTPKILKPAGTIDGQPFADAERQLALPPGTLYKSTTSRLSLEFTDAGGAVKGEGQVVLQGFHVGLIIASLEGLASAIGEAIGGAFGGGGGGAGDYSAAKAVANLPPDLARCRGDFVSTFTLTGTYAAGTGKLNGTYTTQGQFGNLSGCPARANAITSEPLPAEKPLPWNAVFDGTKLTGTFTSAQAGTPGLPFTASVPEEKKPASAPPAVVSPVAGTATEGEGDSEDKETLLPPPVDIKELTPKEGAGAAIIGLGAVALVSVAATAQTAGTAPALEKPERKKEEEPARQPAGPKPIGPDEVEAAGEKLITGFDRAGYDGLAASIEARLADGTFDPATAEHLRERLRQWKARDEALANSDLMTRSDNQAIIDGIREDAAWLATMLGWPGIATLIKEPVMAARIAAAIGTAGASEVIVTPLDVLYTVSKEVAKPGENLSEGDVWGMIGKETAWQVAADVTGEKLVGGAASRFGGGQLDDAARAGLPPSSVADDAARAADDLPAVPREAPSSPRVPQPDIPARGPAVDSGVSLKEAPQGAQVPRERIREAGWTEDQLDDMQRTMKENNTVMGNRASNVDSLEKLENGTSIPKSEPIKAKTTNEHDAFLGIDAKHKGEVTLRVPDEPPFPRPAPGDANADPLHKAVWERFDTRAEEFKKLAPDVAALERQGLVAWDRKTGLITNTGLNPDPATFGKSFGGDIDGVYLRDAKTGEFIPDTDPRAQKVYAELRASKVLAQHRWETNVINDRVARGGEGALSEAVDLHRKLERGHMSGKELTIEVGPNHVQVGPSNINDADWGLDPDWLRTGGTPIVVDERLLNK